MTPRNLAHAMILLCRLAYAEGAAQCARQPMGPTPLQPLEAA